MSMFVYCHESPSKKRYVGISANPTKRWASGKGYSKNYLFSRAISKYGWDNFNHSILFECKTIEDAKAVEQHLIAEWNLTNPKYGYNLRDGGDGSFSEESRSKMSQSRKGNKNSIGRKYSDKTKEKISKSLKGYYSNHPGTFSGRRHSENTIRKLKSREVTAQTREKMRLNHGDVSGAKNPSAKPVVCLSKDGTALKTYPYAKKASQELGIDLSSIIKCCKGKAKSAGGYVWRYWEPGVYGWTEIA